MEAITCCEGVTRYSWLSVKWTHAMSYCDTACSLFALASDGVPSLPA
jgi:hypothetical protein